MSMVATLGLRTAKKNRTEQRVTELERSSQNQTLVDQASGHLRNGGSVPIQY